MTKRGVYISVDGMDGIGKTTLVNHLLEKIGDNVVLYNSLGSNPLSIMARKLITDPTVNLDNISETLLLLAVHTENYVNGISLLLDQGKNVLADRSILSTYAYQGYGASAINGSYESIKLITDFDINLNADYQICITGNVDACLKRCNERKGGKDRMESKDPAFHTAVNQYFLNRCGFDQDPMFQIVNDGNLETFIEKCNDAAAWLKPKLILN